MANPNDIDDLEFEQINSSLRDIKSNAEPDQMKRLVDQVIKMNNLLQRIHNLITAGGPAPTQYAVPDSSDVNNPDQFWRIVDTFRSHLASHDKHLIAHDGHLATLGERIDLLVERNK